MITSTNFFSYRLENKDNFFNFFEKN
jgi:hypothetical protein